MKTRLELRGALTAIAMLAILVVAAGLWLAR